MAILAWSGQKIGPPTTGRGLSIERMNEPAFKNPARKMSGAGHSSKELAPFIETKREIRQRFSKSGFFSPN
jgi:hypothetical protein